MDMTQPRPGVFAPYDPQYDPLAAPHPGRGTDYAPTYWVASAGNGLPSAKALPRS